jgi:hypothetical protein
MMFFKRQRKINSITKWGPIKSEIAWDDETLEWIAKSEQLNVRLTNISRTASHGKRPHSFNDWDETATTWEVHGLLTYPKFIVVKISFTTDQKQFGGFFYNRSDNETFNGRKLNLPLLEVWLSDENEQKALLLNAALRDAIISSRKSAGVRLFKKPGEGLMTPTDKEHGYSYESRYTILGLVTWQELQADRLPKWAVPTDRKDFSLDDLPESGFDLDKYLD